MKGFKEFRELSEQKSDHKAMKDFTYHHVLNTTQSHPTIKKKFVKKFGSHNVKHFDNHVSDLIDQYDPLQEQTEDSVRKKLKLAMAKSKRMNRSPKVSYMDVSVNPPKLKSGEYQGMMSAHGFSYAKIQEPGKNYMSTVPLPQIRTVIP
tara:strand:+ start:269 stop:715 length:447 start_codon:yes stop_codon:yes gene_type:complete